MSVYMTQFAASQTKTLLLPALADKLIRVRRLWVSAYRTLSFMLYADPNGPHESILLPKLWLPATDVVDLHFGRRYGLSTAKGLSLGLTSESLGDPQDHTIVLWYERVG